MKTKKFNCTQQELIAICLHSWEICSQNIESFTALKPKYTLTYVTERKTEVESVASMPDSVQRRGQLEVQRSELKRTLKLALKTWRHLKRIISVSWPKEELNGYLNEVGKTHFEKAYGMKWESGYVLMTNAKDFIAKHALKLQEGENMSAAFIENFNQVYNAYATAYLTYLDSLRKSQLGTENLLDAQNKLFTDLMEMFGDAKTIFENKTALYQQFVFENVLKQVSGSNMAGLKGVVTNGAIPAVEIPNILITIKELGESTEADEEGRFIFSPLAAGLYTVEVVADGYKPQSIPGVEVKTSTMATLNIVLEHL